MDKINHDECMRMYWIYHENLGHHLGYHQYQNVSLVLECITDYTVDDDI